MLFWWLFTAANHITSENDYKTQLMYDLSNVEILETRNAYVTECINWYRYMQHMILLKERLLIAIR